jgi:hypothetical protein
LAFLNRILGYPERIAFVLERVLLLDVGYGENLCKDLLKPLFLPLFGQYARLNKAVEGVDLHIQQVRHVELKPTRGICTPLHHVS